MCFVLPTCSRVKLSFPIGHGSAVACFKSRLALAIRPGASRLFFLSSSRSPVDPAFSSLAFLSLRSCVRRRPSENNGTANGYKPTPSSSLSHAKGEPPWERLAQAAHDTLVHAREGSPSVLSSHSSLLRIQFACDSGLRARPEEHDERNCAGWRASPQIEPFDHHAFIKKWFVAKQGTRCCC